MHRTDRANQIRGGSGSQKRDLRVHHAGEWRRPSKHLVFGLVLLLFFLIVAGVPYDIVNDAPSVGSYVDSKGRRQPSAFVVGRLNAQFIFEGIAAGFLVCLGGVGMIMIDGMLGAFGDKRILQSGLFRQSAYRHIAFVIALGAVAVSYFSLQTFMRIKLP